MTTPADRSDTQLFFMLTVGTVPENMTPSECATFARMYDAVCHWLPRTKQERDDYVAGRRPSGLFGWRCKYRPPEPPKGPTPEELEMATLRAIHGAADPSIPAGFAIRGGVGNISIRSWIQDNKAVTGGIGWLDGKTVSRTCQRLLKHGDVIATGVMLGTNWHLTNKGRARIGIPPEQAGEAEAYNAYRRQPALAERAMSEAMDAIRAEGAAEVLAILTRNDPTN